MMFRLFSIEGTLLLHFIGTVLADMSCYNGGFTFKKLLGDSGDMTQPFTDFCDAFKDQAFENGHHVRKETLI